MAASTLPSRLPIIQAPMAGGPSTPELTAAVARAGGFGFVAAGYLTPDQLVRRIAETQTLTDAPFGVNLFSPSPPSDPGPIRGYANRIQPESDRLGVPLGEPRWDDDAFGDKVAIVAAAGVSMASFTFGCPDPEAVERLHGAGCRVAVTVTSPAEAQRADGAGADLLIVQGTEAGGHQATFLDLAPNTRPLTSLLEEVAGSTAIPLIGSGGIMTGARIAEVLQLGAIGVQLGTVFLCADEAGTSAVYRQALLDRLYGETVVTRAFSGHFARGLANEFAVRYSDDAPVGYPEIHHLTRPLRAAATQAGDPTTPNFWAGQGWKAVASEPTATIMARLATELAAALGRPAWSARP
jgi:nitronate monooxygenase